MDQAGESMHQILQALTERAKELNCLYRIDEILNQRDAREADIYQQVLEAIPPGWQYQDVCEAQIEMDGEVYRTARFEPSQASMSAPIEVQEKTVGAVTVAYRESRPPSDEGPFLKEERRLITTIAQRISQHLLQRRLLPRHMPASGTTEPATEARRPSWEVLIAFLRRTDRDLLGRINRRMINHLCWSGVQPASDLLLLPPSDVEPPEEAGPDENQPLRRREFPSEDDLTRRTFDLAAAHLSESEIISCIQTWISEEKSMHLLQALENPECGLAETAEALKRFDASGLTENDLPPAMQATLRVALLRRYFVDQPDYINVAKDYVAIDDLHEVVDHLVHPRASHGKLGGKGAGLLLARQILRHSDANTQLLQNLRVPKTWYVASDGLLAFVHYNNLEEVYNRKYMEPARVRQEYPHIIQLFKHSQFPPEMSKGLATALDDFGNRPIIVRSSSLLEDRSGASFAGKYKSLFLANQGGRAERLAALEDAIAEIYASAFGPDPIEYRADRNLLHFTEEMGVLIQEVVGRKTGRYFTPAFAGVAFSSNEFRWSPRIRAEDGLLRIVPGLGTRAVDRMSNDYPILVSPGQPTLRVNVSPDEIVRYAPRRVDVIDLESNALATVDVTDLLREVGAEYPLAHRLVSMVERDNVRAPSGLEPNWESDDFVVTLEGVLTQTPFVQHMRQIIEILRDRLGTDVDIEFAHDGEHLYIVQCRAQSRSHEYAPAEIPRDTPRETLLFSASRYVPNGHVSNITHVVYVDPVAYARLGSYLELKEVASVIGQLNRALPKRQFVLLGPGRWGSRGDIKLGVNVSYADISNTAMLLEIAHASGAYTPELSFGTHFFQDMVEAGIRYLPLYPEDPDGFLNEQFLRSSRNVLAALLPEQAELSRTVRVIDVQAETGGRVLHVLMNAEEEEAIGIFARGNAPPAVHRDLQRSASDVQHEHWRWRLRMVERIASSVDAPAFGIKGVYLIGSVKNATAGPGSDIDLLIHDEGHADQRARLMLWLDGWSRALAEVNYLRTGQESDGLLDTHFVTDDDIAKRTSFAVKIGAVTDAARPLRLFERAEDSE